MNDRLPKLDECRASRYGVHIPQVDNDGKPVGKCFVCGTYLCPSCGTQTVTGYPGECANCEAAA